MFISDNFICLKDIQNWKERFSTLKNFPLKYCFLGWKKCWFFENKAWIYRILWIYIYENSNYIYEAWIMKFWIYRKFEFFFIMTRNSIFPSWNQWFPPPPRNFFLLHPWIDREHIFKFHVIFQRTIVFCLLFVSSNVMRDLNCLKNLPKNSEIVPQQFVKFKRIFIDIFVNFIEIFVTRAI